MSSFVLRIKLFFRDRTAVICWIACAAVMIAVLFQLNIHAAERSAIPVGLEVRDDSVIAGRVRDRIRENEALYVYEGDYEYLYGLLADGYVYCIIRLDENFGTQIMNGKTDKIMTMYSAKDNKVAAVVGDIAAGCLMDAVCMYKAYNVYSSLEGEHLITDIDDYAGLLSQMETTGGFDYTFDVTYIDTGAADERQISNGLIYKQVITGLMGMLLMLCAFCSCSAVTREFENGIRRRRSTCAKSRMLLGIGEIAGMFVCSSPLALTALLLGSGRGYGNVALMVLCNLGMILFAVVLYYLTACVTGSVFAYQLLGGALLIVLGICGLISIFEGIAGSEIFSYMPAGAYIKLMCRLL